MTGLETKLYVYRGYVKRFECRPMADRGEDGRRRKMANWRPKSECLIYLFRLFTAIGRLGSFYPHLGTDGALRQCMSESRTMRYYPQLVRQALRSMSHHVSFSSHD